MSYVNPLDPLSPAYTAHAASHAAIAKTQKEATGQSPSTIEDTVVLSGAGGAKQSEGASRCLSSILDEKELRQEESDAEEEARKIKEHYSEAGKKVLEGRYGPLIKENPRLLELAKLKEPEPPEGVPGRMDVLLKPAEIYPNIDIDDTKNEGVYVDPDKYEEELLKKEEELLTRGANG